MITNNVDFYNYMKNRGVWCTYFKVPPQADPKDELVVVFPKYHNMTVCGNRFNESKKDDYRIEANDMLDWLEWGNRIICVTPVIKWDSLYMKTVAPDAYERCKKTVVTKQVIHTKDIGELLVPHRLQLRYKNVKPIDFDIVATKNLFDPCQYWYDANAGYLKKQQVHYFNVLNASHDTLTRRKLRYIPEYALFSQLYKKLYL